MAKVNQDKLIEIFKESIVGYDHLIDKVYYEDGISALKDLELRLPSSSGNFNGSDDVLKYLEEKIIKIEAADELKNEQIRC